MQQVVQALLAKQRDNDDAGTDERLARVASNARSSGSTARQPRLASGSRIVSRSARAPRARSGYRTPPTTSRPRGPPVKVWCRATPVWPRWTRSTKGIVEAQAHRKGSQPRTARSDGRCAQRGSWEGHRGVCGQRLSQRRELEASRSAGRRGVHPRPRLQRARPAIRRPRGAPGQARPLWDKSPEKHGKAKLFRPQDFQVADDFFHFICPAGKWLYRDGNNRNIGRRRAVKFGAQRDCENCPLRAQCLRHPHRSKFKQVAIFVGTHAQSEETATERMKRKTDTDKGREMITRRFATVAPVFGNIRNNKRMNRFTL